MVLKIVPCTDVIWDSGEAGIMLLSFPNVSIGNPVVLKVYDITGREIQTLVNERLLAGTYETTFDGSMLNSGVYFYKLTTDGFSESKRMILLK